MNLHCNRSVGGEITQIRCFPKGQCRNGRHIQHTHCRHAHRNQHSRKQSVGVSLRIGAYTRRCVSFAAVAERDTATNTFEAEALLFDCDGVILLSEEVHRIAYNETWKHFNITCQKDGPVANWSVEFYDMLQNSVGGGKEKMRWFFNREGWPHSSVLPGPPETDADKLSLVDALQDWKSSKYQELIAGGTVPARAGVVELFDQAKEAGLKLGVCSAATKSSVIAVLEALLGPERFKSLDVFLAGDDIPKKKPDPTVYTKAADMIGVSPQNCLVVEDSAIGLQAAKAAGMRCIITYTDSTKGQPFEGADLVLEGLEYADPPVKVKLLKT